MYDARRYHADRQHHTLAMLVYDEAGVLARIANMFMKRNFNIRTMTVGPSTKPGVSRMTISFFGDNKMYEQMVKQLNKLIDVIKVSDLMEKQSVIRELALVKIKAKTVNDQNLVMNYCHAYRARVVSVSHDNMIVEIVGKSEKIDSFLKLVQKQGVKEISRTGVTAMNRGKEQFEKF